ncbi:type II secretion system protein N [uncultured Pseudacidovorax sp.]|uniref:type II secretion system protein N n=1 Tax=uncultured Pseudacidovorax sp. TaxID=679313 RepID=UPI0025DB2C75|nr:type II secretion system protein N [uncultured Pseudacidovorax sp.]
MATTALLWAAAAASAVYWGLRLAAPVDSALAPPVAVPALGVDTGDVARAFGAVKVAASAPMAPDVASRFRLLGVAADRDGGGVALIAVDGKPPRSYRAGAAFDGQLVLQSIDAAGAHIGPAAGGTGFRLTVPPRPLAVNGPPRSLVEP